MHFTGRTWRPPYEAHSVIIQAASGCTWHKCRFCSLYKNECFRMSPMEEFEEDLAEIKSYQPNARRIFWTGANPFAMSYENLKLRALTVRDYLIKCQTMAMFASIRDIKNKEVWQLKKLRAMGINGLSIGVESGDDETLALANKGYTSADILEQCRKLDEAGIEYYFVYMTGLAGKGSGYQNAGNSAELFSRLNPYFISVDSLTLFPDTELYQMAQQGLFVPAGEKERIRELQILINNLKIRTHLFANTVSNFAPVTAYLPYDREKVTSELQYVLQAKMQAHQQITPIRTQDMQPPCQHQPAPYGQKRKHMPGHGDPAVHQREHCRKRQDIYEALQGSHGGIPSPEQILIPAPVKDLMDNKQHKHPCPDPLMSGLAPELITHQEKQRRRHQDVQRPLYFCLCVHTASACESFSL